MTRGYSLVKMGCNLERMVSRKDSKGYSLVMKDYNLVMLVNNWEMLVNMKVKMVSMRDSLDYS